MSQENETVQAALNEALSTRTPRYFRASGGNAHGQTGYQDTERFAENLMVLQECALLVGERLEMNAVSYAYIYDGEETIGFRFDQSTDPANPQVVGAIQNRRVSMRDFTTGLNEYMEGGHK
ncbi:MAG: hypothetical protein P1U89_05710 [Verrucomicrobiales bacterium]|nr:hypothetical protein [Verrucomicrobiales bacterium]